MACRCVEKGMCLRDIERLNRARGFASHASGEDSGMNNDFNGGKGAIPPSFTADTEGELSSSMDEVHNEVSNNISGCSSEISEALQRVHERYEAYCVEDEAYHAEQERLAKMGA